MNPPPSAAARRAELDWIRVAAFGLLILYHVGMFYVPWDWHVKSPRQSEWLEWAMFATNPWRLSLLFLVSGAATRYLAARRSAGSLALDRAKRLLPPLLLAMFVIVPPQSFLEIREKAGIALPYLDFWKLYASGFDGWCRGDDCLRVPTWNHMWFVAYLLVYSLALATLVAVLPRFAERGQGWMERLLAGWGLLLWPILYLAAIRLGLLSRFPITHGLFDDGYNHALSFAMFLLGYWLAPSDRLWACFGALRRPAALLWLTGYAVFTTYAWIYRADDAMPPEALRMTMRVVYAAEQWAAIAAILGYAHRYLQQTPAWLSELNRGVFCFYLMHQTLIVVFAYLLARQQWPIGVEVGALLLLVFGGCAATYLLVRRVPLLHPWFGIAPQRRRGQSVDLPRSTGLVEDR